MWRAAGQESGHLTNNSLIMSKVINTSDSALEIQFLGVNYRVEAGGSLDNVPPAAAEYWKTMIHNFIVIVDEEVAQAPVAAPVVEEAEVEVAPEVAVEAETEVVEVAEEAPAAPKKGKK